MKKLRLRVATLGLVCGTLLLGFPIPVTAAVLSQRAVTVADPSPSAVTTHEFSFTVPSTDPVASIVFEYCLDPFFDTVCSAPGGLNVTNATLLSQTGTAGFSIDPVSTANRLVVGRAVAASVTGAVAFNFGTLQNSSTAGQTIYVKIGTHGSVDGTGTRIDRGAVAFRVLHGIGTEAYVPPFLVFCAGLIVSLDCSSVNGSFINLGDLSTSQTKTGTSQYSGATNDESGYQVSLFGTTLTSGNNVIPALTAPTPSQIGDSQFGLNVRANTVPAVGEDPVGASGTAMPSSRYGTSNVYAFTSGDLISSASESTAFNRFTASYIVNIADQQPAGIYSATLTFVAVATF